MSWEHKNVFLLKESTCNILKYALTFDRIYALINYTAIVGHAYSICHIGMIGYLLYMILFIHLTSTSKLMFKQI